MRPNLHVNLKTANTWILIKNKKIKISEVSDKKFHPYPVDTNYLKIKIKGNVKLTAIEKIMDITLKMIQIYNFKKEEVIDSYKKIDKDFDLDLDEKKIEENTSLKSLHLRKLEPLIFTSNFARKCQKFPTLIPDDKVEEFLRNGKQVLRFPKEHTTINGVKINPRNYVSPYESHPFVGLQENKIDGAPFGFMPCCYVRDQSGDLSSPFTKYFHPEIFTAPKISKIQQKIFTSNKFANIGKYGFLPSKLVSILQTLDTSNEFMIQNFLRLGVNNSSRSFLYCVLHALSHNISSGTSEMSEPHFYNICKQEMFDYSVEEIQDYIEVFGDSTTHFLDPRKCYRFFEKKFNCRIFVFERKKNDQSIELAFPHYCHSFAESSYNSTDKVILIYQHWGGEIESTNKGGFPRCELICKSETEFTFTFLDSVVKNICKLFTMMNHNQDPITNIESFNFEICSQVLNSYGKTKIIIVKNRDFLYQFEFEANGIPPLPVPNLSSYDSSPDFTKKILLGNIGAKISRFSNAISTSTSIFKTFCLENQIERGLQQHFIWLFSKFCVDNNRDASCFAELETRLEFIKSCVKIDPFKSRGSTEIFSEFGNFVVFKNKKILQHMLSTLELYIRRNYSLVENFYKEEFADIFHSRLDFDINSDHEYII